MKPYYYYTVYILISIHKRIGDKGIGDKIYLVLD